ncbi:hypothetical protein LCGC14_2730560, partial [marine sediment metagenome]
TNYAGWANRSKMMLLTHGVEAMELGKQTDSGFIVDPRKFQTSDIARFWRVPGFMIGLEEKTSSWGTGVAEMKQALITFTFKPWTDRWAQALAQALLTEEEQEEYFIEFLYADLLRGDLKSQMESYKTGREIGVLCPNDIRRLENMNPIPEEKGGNDYHVPMNWSVSGAPKELPAPKPAEPAQIEGPSPENGENEENGVTASAHAQIGTQFKRLIHDAANRITQKETKRIRHLAKNYLGKPGGFQQSFEAFYDSFPEYIKGLMLPTLLTFAAALQNGSANENDLDPFVSEYASTLGADHAANSRAELRQIMGPASQDAIDEAVRLMDEWEQRRPDEIAGREIVAFAEAVDTFTFAANGVEDSNS